jgi:hypothetical protein
MIPAIPRAGTGRLVPPIVVAASLLIAAVFIGASRGPNMPLTGQQCLDRGDRVTLDGTHKVEYQEENPRNGVTYDLRQLKSTAYPYESLYPLAFGEVEHGRSETPPARELCIIGGTVIGQQARDLTWQEIKSSHDGDGLRIDGTGWYVVDGLRVDNVEDGIGVFGENFVLRNLYFTHIRDDCVENDALAEGLISDSLFDGCFMGVSERPSEGFNISDPSSGTLTLNRVLVRLEPMAHDDASSGVGNGQLFKWSSLSNRLMLRDSIFLVEQESLNGSDSMVFPENTEARNVTLVWTGAGAYPGPLPSGVTVTRDRSIWEDARCTWLARHGYG